jgi:hypothetical protein
MFSLMSDERQEQMGPYIGQVDEVPLVNDDGSPKLDEAGKPIVIKLRVVASTAGKPPEPEGPQQ